MNGRRLTFRFLGGILILLGFTVLGQGDSAWSPAAWLALIVGAYLITQAIFAIALTTFALALMHYLLGNVDLLGVPRPGVFLGVAGLSLACCIYIKARQFRVRIRETREARWAQRKP